MNEVVTTCAVSWVNCWHVERSISKSRLLLRAAVAQLMSLVTLAALHNLFHSGNHQKLKKKKCLWKWCELWSPIVSVFQLAQLSQLLRLAGQRARRGPFRQIRGAAVELHVSFIILAAFVHFYIRSYGIYYIYTIYIIGYSCRWQVT